MVFRRAVDQPNRWAFGCRANVNGERVAVRRAAGKLFQMTGSATTKLFIPSVVLVLGTDNIAVPADRRCRLSAMAEIARQSSANHVGANTCSACKLSSPACTGLVLHIDTLWIEKKTRQTDRQTTDGCIYTLTVRRSQRRPTAMVKYSLLFKINTMPNITWTL